MNKDYVPRIKIVYRIKECELILHSIEQKKEKKLGYVDRNAINCLLAQISILTSLLESE